MYQDTQIDESKGTHISNAYNVPASEHALSKAPALQGGYCFL